jgi:hypothetical protein
MSSFYEIDAYTVKLADQAILMIVFGLTFITFLLHVVFDFRYRYSWHRISVGVNDYLDFFNEIFDLF